jgi:hypothetical protein
VFAWLGVADNPGDLRNNENPRDDVHDAEPDSGGPQDIFGLNHKRQERRDRDERAAPEHDPARTPAPTHDQRSDGANFRGDQREQENGKPRNDGHSGSGLHFHGDTQKAGDAVEDEAHQPGPPSGDSRRVRHRAHSRVG